jgi:prolipoprotein diacylglyceryltransferase
MPLGDLLGVFGGCVVIGAVTSRVFWLFLEPSVDFGRLGHDPWTIFDPRLGGHSSFGALAGALAVVGLWARSASQKTWHGPRTWSVRASVDALAVGGLGGLALARLGCLANGCDFGKQTDLGWAVRHGPGTDAFHTHVERGWVALDAAWSAPVHPFALYLVVGTLSIVAWAVWAIGARRFNPGRVALWACGAYLGLRFAAEWTRDDATVLNLYAGFNIHHLFALLGLGALAAAGVWLRACDTEAAQSSSDRHS